MPDIAELIRSMPTVHLAAESAEKYAYLRNPDWNPGKELYKAMERKFKQYGHLADLLTHTRRRPLIYANPVRLPALSFSSVADSSSVRLVLGLQQGKTHWKEYVRYLSDERPR